MPQVELWAASLLSLPILLPFAVLSLSWDVPDGDTAEDWLGMDRSGW
ncbi:unnamed protein product, partial [marine sediment metagenome]